MDHSNSLCLVSRRVLTEKNTTKVKESVFIIVVNIFLFSDLLITVVCPPPTVTNPGFRTMYYYSTQVNKYAFNCTIPHGMAFFCMTHNSLGAPEGL